MYVYIGEHLILRVIDKQFSLCLCAMALDFVFALFYGENIELMNSFSGIVLMDSNKS